MSTSAPPAPATSTSAPPAPNFVDPVDVAPGPGGELWVADYKTDTITIMKPRGRGLALVREISASGGPNRLAVDRSGLIWAAMWDDSDLVAWNPAAARARPALTIHVTGMEEPTGLRFGARGWLWVTTQTGTALLGLSPAQLRRSGSVRAARRIPVPSGQGGPLDEDVAFDAHGSAYVVQYNAEKVVVFASLNGPNPRPVRIVDLTGDGPVGAQRGPDGAVWITNSASTNLVRLWSCGARRQTVQIAGANMPHSVTFIGDRAYVTDPGAFLLAYRVEDLRRGSAKPVIDLNPQP